MKDWVGNYHSVCGCLGAHNECKEDREIHDYYATQPIAAELLTEIETLDKNIWECACGEGHLAKVFESKGFNVKSTDLIDRGFGQGGVDFLKQTEKFDGDIVTNPPYKYAQEFIEKALDLVTDGHKVCMFLKVQFLEGKTRRKMYDLAPPPHGMGINEPYSMRKERRFQRLNGCLCVVYMGKGLQRRYSIKMV